MLKTMVIVIALLIAVVNVSAQTGRTQKSGRRVHPTAIRVGPPTTYLKEGLTAEQVLRVLGEPIDVSQREEQGVTITTLHFQRGANRVLVAEFVNDALVSSRTETRVSLVASNRS